MLQYCVVTKSLARLPPTQYIYIYTHFISDNNLLLASGEPVVVRGTPAPARGAEPTSAVVLMTAFLRAVNHRTCLHGSVSLSVFPTGGPS